MRLKRVISLFLALALALSLSLPVLAVEGTGSMAHFTAVRDYVPFSDVPDGAWYAADVKQAYELGIIGGKENGAFDPEGELTVAEAVALMVRTACIYYGWPAPQAGGTPWYQSTVDFAIRKGLLTEGEFSSYDAPATRGEMARLFGQALPTAEYTRINRIVNIPDVDNGNADVDYIYLLYSAGITTGSDGGRYYPNELVHRCEAAALITRVALPDSRRAFSLSEPAVGTQVTGGVTGCTLVLPFSSWTSADPASAGTDGSAELYLTSDRYGASIVVERFAKPADWGGLAALEQLALSSASELAAAGMAVEQAPYYCLMRGYPGFRLQMTGGSGGSAQTGLECYLLENASSVYRLTLRWDKEDEAARTEGYEQMFDILYTFDMPL